MSTMNFAGPNWTYSAEGVETLVGTITNSTSNDIIITEVTANLGSMHGTSTDGTTLTGTGGAISTYVKVGSTKSNTLSINNSVDTNGSYPLTEYCKAYTFSLSVKLAKGSSANIYISTPATTSGGTGLVLVYRMGEQYSYVTYSISNVTITYDANGGSKAPAATTGSPPLTITSSKPTGAAREAKFNANGGSVSPASITKNLVFSHWTTNADGSGTKYNSESTYSGTSDITLYAQYTTPTLGTLPTPTRSNANFLGWFTAASGGTQISSSTPISNKTYYAHWSFNITFKCNWTNPSGTIYDPTNDIGPDTQIVYVKQDGVNLQIPDLIVTPEPDEQGETSPVEWDGYWTDTSGTRYRSGGYYTKNQGDTLVCGKAEISYTVTWKDGYSGAVLKTLSNVTPGTTLTKADFPLVPVREGYTFTGWFGSWTNIQSDTVITAMWGKSKIWIYTKDKGWQQYKPREVK